MLITYTGRSGPLPSTPYGQPDYSEEAYPFPKRNCNPLPWREREYPYPWFTHCQLGQVLLSECLHLGRLPFVIALVRAPSSL